MKVQKSDGLVEQAESHVVVRLLGLFLLGLLLGGGRGSTSGSGGGGGGRSSAGGTDSGSDVGEEVLDVDALESLGEEAGPVGLHVDLGGLQDGLNLLTGDGDVLIFLGDNFLFS